MKYIFKFLVLSMVIIGLGGCSSRSIVVKKPEAQILADKTKAYVVFTRPYNFVGAANSIDIVHFNNRNFDVNYVAYLSAGERVIFKVNEGENYFFTDVGANENIQVVNAKKGKIYYINLGVTASTIFFPKLYKEDRLQFVNTLKGTSCSNKLLKKYLFKKDKEKKEKSSYAQKKNTLITYSSPTQVRISCDNNKVVKVEDRYYGHTLEELKQVELVKPNEKAFKVFNREKKQYVKDIKAYYPTWNFKFRDVPMSENTFLEIKKSINDIDFKKYTMVNILASNLNTIDKKVLNKLRKKLNAKFQSLDSKNILTIEFTINKLDTGNMFGRYMTMGIAKNAYRSNIGVIDVDINLKNSAGLSVGSFRLTELEVGGFLGGIDTLESDINDIIFNYINTNYLQ